MPTPAPPAPPAPLAARVAALREQFARQFGAPPSLVARAPGRVNLIGEHTDYNEGFVFPIAIERDTLVAARPRPDRQVRAFSATLRRGSQWSLDAVEPSRDQAWSNYLRGVARFLEEAGVALPGADLAVASTVPLGAGVSSSAALEMATGTALLALAGAAMDPPTLARLCQRVENRFVGVNSGIMDQFIAGLGRAGHALLLDCRDLHYEQVALPDDHVIGVADTGVKHGLVASEYNARRAECEEGVRLLQPVLPGVRTLRDVAPEQLEANRDRLPERVYRRCRHVVSEDDRVLRAVAALRAGDLATVGEQMYASHASLRDDYEVTVPELDALVEAARGVRGVIGSRMTGGGFGGATVTLMERRAAPHWERTVHAAYRERFGRTPATFTTAAANGAGIVWRAEPA
jgi:galactokinase